MKTIVILNDNAHDIDNLLYILDGHYDVLVTLDVEESIELIEQESVDLFLLSLDLEKNEDTKLLQAILKEKKIPTILTTCRENKENKENKEQKIIIKSFNTSELMSKIERIL